MTLFRGHRPVPMTWAGGLAGSAAAEDLGGEDGSAETPAAVREARTLIADLNARSPEFAALWARHEVGVRRDDRKRVNHPALGTLEVNCLSLLSEDGRQRLLWFTPAPGTDSAGKLELLAVVGTQLAEIPR